MPGSVPDNICTFIPPDSFISFFLKFGDNVKSYRKVAKIKIVAKIARIPLT